MEIISFAAFKDIDTHAAAAPKNVILIAKNAEILISTLCVYARQTTSCRIWTINVFVSRKQQIPAFTQRV